VPVADAPGMAVALASHGLLVRAFRQLPGVGDALRITVGPWTTMQRLLEALHAIA
jgi:histidinol-phosphate/aromatic aminotransferase/cobyric acid decarboxylase-like protein